MRIAARSPVVVQIHWACEGGCILGYPTLGAARAMLDRWSAPDSHTRGVRTSPDYVDLTRGAQYESWMRILPAAELADIVS